MNILFLTISRINGLEERGIYTDLMREFIRNGHAMYIVSPYERRFHQPTGVMENGGARILWRKGLLLCCWKASIYMLLINTGGM